MAAFFVSVYNLNMLRQPKIVALLPGLAGLFFARLLLEGWALWRHTAVSLSLIALTSTLAVALLTRLIQHHPIVKTWPLLILLLYVFFPQPMPRFALGLLAAVALLFLLPTLRTASKRPLLEATAIAGLALLFYLPTLSPDVLAADNGEFQWIGTRAGVLHPPGFPLYTVMAFLISQLPIPTAPALKITLFSTITSSATLFFVYLTTHHLTRQRLAAVTAVAALATATTFWAQATTANIRSLTALFAAAALYFLVQLPTTQTQFDRRLLYAVLATGLGVGHHPSLLFFAIVFVIYVLWLDKGIILSWQRIRPLGVALLLSALPYLYLPLRAGADAPGARASLATWRGFWNHALARGFSGDFFYFIEPAIFAERLRVMANVLTFQFFPFLLLGMGIGFAMLLRQDRRLAFLLGGAFLLHTAVTATYRAPQTVEYMLPAYLPLAILLGVAVWQLSTVTRQGSMSGVWGSTAAAALFVVAANQGIVRWESFRGMAQSSETRDYVNTVLRDAPNEALVLADWHWYTPLRYAQAVEGQRPDLEIRFVAPEGSSYGATWRDRIKIGLDDGRFVVATHYDLLYESLPSPQPLGEAFLFAARSDARISDGETEIEPFDIDGVTVLGVQFAEEGVIGDVMPITVAWQSETQTTLYVHLVGFDGRLYAQDDQPILPGRGVTRFQPVLRPGSQPGAFAVYIGAGGARGQVGTVNASAAPFAPVTRHPHHLRIPGDAKTLVGHDWDQTLPARTRLYLHWQTPQGYFSTAHDDEAAVAVQINLIGGWGRAVLWSPSLPDRGSHYVSFGRGIVWLGGDLLGELPLRPGQTLTPRLLFGSRAPIFRDTAISVRLIGFEADQYTWAWTSLNDAIPALGAVPTLKWIAGSRVTSPHAVTVADTAVSGQTVALTLRLYDAFTNRPLPILDERITEQLQWVPLDSTSIE